MCGSSQRLLACAAVLLSWTTLALADEENRFAFEHAPPRLKIVLDGRPIATYVYRDEQISRPYFCDLYTRQGTRVTRNHPPIAGQDLTDHETFHPGLWLAFGDLGGSDFWRLKARVEHAGFVEEPAQAGSTATFAVKNRYVAQDGMQQVCEEICRYRLTALERGYLLETASEFQNPQGDFAFGDQEEMGLGVRLATGLIVKNGGQITNSQGDRDEAGAWGKAARWCDYSGVLDGRRVGVLMIPSPRNVRESWFHVRDYGLMVGNPFGREALTRGEASRVEVRAGAPFRLAYGVLIYEQADAAPLDADEVFATYSRLEAER